MQWHEFAFSEKRSYRLLRHSVFWTAWWLYFIVCYYLYQQPPAGKFKPLYVTVGSHLSIKTLFLLLLAAVACYTFLYLLLPQIVKGKRWKAVANILLLCVCLYGAGYWLYWWAFPFIDSLFGLYKPNRFPTRFWPAVSLGLWEPLKVMAAAGIIKYVKHWWLQQKEKEKLEREKTTAELQLLKAQIQPQFLFTSLKTIHKHLLSASPEAPGMLLKLSDLLSYMLYECDQPLVPLEKEVEMMREYVTLEKIKSKNAIDVELTIRGDINDKKIAPFLLLPFIENSFQKSSRSNENAWINMDITIEDDALVMKLANGSAADAPHSEFFQEEGCQNIIKRLNLIYPRKHELKILHEREMMLVILKITLVEATAVQSTENEEPEITNLELLQSRLYVVPK